MRQTFDDVWNRLNFVPPTISGPDVRFIFLLLLFLHIKIFF